MYKKTTVLVITGQNVLPTSHHEAARKVEIFETYILGYSKMNGTLLLEWNRGSKMMELRRMI